MASSDSKRPTGNRIEPRIEQVQLPPAFGVVAATVQSLIIKAKLAESEFTLDVVSAQLSLETLKQTG